MICDILCNCCGQTFKSWEDWQLRHQKRAYNKVRKIHRIDGEDIHLRILECEDRYFSVEIRNGADDLGVEKWEDWPDSERGKQAVVDALAYEIIRLTTELDDARRPRE